MRTSSTPRPFLNLWRQTVTPEERHLLELRHQFISTISAELSVPLGYHSPLEIERKARSCWDRVVEPGLNRLIVVLPTENAKPPGAKQLAFL